MNPVQAPGTPWRRRGARGDSVREELLRRTLTTMDACDALWDAARDPLALAGAVMLSDLPRGLQNGLLAALMLAALVPGAPAANAARVFTRAGRQSTRDRTAAARAFELSRLRAHPALGRRLPLTWEKAAALVSYLLRDTEAAGTPAAMRQAYHRVARQLLRDPWRFWAPPPGFKARYLSALAELVEHHAPARASRRLRPRRLRRAQ